MINSFSDLTLELAVKKGRASIENDKRYKRKLSELSLIDDYLFGLFVQETSNEEIFKSMIECMLGVKIKEIHIKQKQHEISAEPDFQGIRLDAFLQGDDKTLYNIEVQTSSKGNLAKRMRYYQSLIDREQMPSGEYDYSRLPKTIIIFVTDFDPFKKSLYRYTFRNVCAEDSSLELNDESIKVVLNTKGQNGKGVNTELIELLKYFRSSTRETADESESLLVKTIEEKLEPIRNSPKFGGDYMSYQEKIYIERMEAKEEGIEIGEKRGREKGIEIGEKRGKQEERIKLEKRLRELGASEEMIRAAMAN